LVRRLLAVVLLLSVATAARAQERIGAPERAAAPFDASRVEPSRTTLDRKFWIVAAALNTAMVVDTKSTFDVVRACETCREANPFVAPFVRRGQVLTLAAGEAFDAGVMTLAAKMKGSDHVWARRTWWLVPAALSVGHTIAARHNSNLLK